MFMPSVDSDPKIDDILRLNIKKRENIIDFKHAIYADYMSFRHISYMQRFRYVMSHIKTGYQEVS